MAELLDLETSFQEMNKIPIAPYVLIPINAELSHPNFVSKINKLKFPVWLKLNTSEHKVDINAVKKCINQEELIKTHNQFKKTFKQKTFIVQQDVQGEKILVGIKSDSTFNKFLLIGAGGHFTELINDVKFRILPLNEKEIEKTIRQLKIYKILEEEKANIKKLIKLIKQLSELEIEEADFNPVIVNEKEAVVVDARMRLED